MPQPAAAHVAAQDGRPSPARPRASRAIGAVAAPIRAGMRARAVADACERLDLAAILIDRAGRVLHVGARAWPLMKDAVSVRAGHLVGADRLLNAVVQKAVTAAVGKTAIGPTDEPVGASLSMTGLRFRDRSPYQLLAGVLVVSEGGRPPSAGLASLRTLLSA